jgi:hypothetical protein
MVRSFNRNELSFSQNFPPTGLFNAQKRPTHFAKAAGFRTTVGRHDEEGKENAKRVDGVHF